jgi:hypothetical protein
MNNKAISTPLMVIIVIVIIVIAGVAFSQLGVAPTTNTPSAVSVYFENVEYNTNLTDAHAIDWGAVVPGNSYSKNFTVVNNDAQPLWLKLLTTEPQGTHQTWAYNNTQIAAGATNYGSLTLNLDVLAASGTYTWRLYATNGTSATPTPTVTMPPQQTVYSLTIVSGIGLSNINVTVGADKLTFTPASLPKTLNFNGDAQLAFSAEASSGYAFNFWELSDGTLHSSNPYTISQVTGNFTVTANFITATPT